MSTRLVSVMLFLGLLLVVSVATPLVGAAPTGEVAAQETLTPVPTAQGTPVPDGTPAPAAAEGESLPAGVARIFAALGLFIVTIFTLAIGTEVVVDVIKLALGLQSKPTARKSMEQFQDLLPGDLDKLGVSAEAQAQLQQQVMALQDFLQPVVTAEDVIVQLKEGHLKDAVQTIMDELEAGELPGRVEIATLVKDQLHTAVDKTRVELGLSDAVTAPILARLDRLVDDLAEADWELLLQRSVAFLQGEIADITTAWVRKQANLLASGGRSLVERQYRQQLRPALAGFGLGDEQLQMMDEWLAVYLDKYEEQGGQVASVYLESLNQLLQGVERQRQLIQSPLHRFWLWLRRVPLVGLLVRGMEKAWRRISGPAGVKPMATLHIESPTDAARVMLELERRHQDEDAIRIKWIRLISVVVGIILAFLLQMDSADLLSGVLIDSGFLRVDIIPKSALPGNYALTAGIILSGLAASAGSSFWHEQLGRLQMAKRATESAYRVVRDITDEA